MPAVVLGGGLTALDVLRCLHLAGIPSMLVSGRDDVAQRSRLPVRRHVHHSIAPDDMASELEALDLGDVVAIPCNDHWASAVTKLMSEGRRRPRLVTPGPVAIDTLTDKLTFAKLLQQQSVPHPTTLALPAVASLDELDEATLRSGFLKPLDSQRSVEVFGRKAFPVDDLAQARGTLQTALDAGVPLMFQEYVVGPAQHHTFLDGFIGSDGTEQVVLARRRLRLFPDRYGNSSLTEVIPLDAAVEQRQSIRRVLEALDYVGPFCAEFAYDERSGRHLLLEINGRCWWQVGLTAACGANVPERIYRDAIGQPLPPVEVDAVGTRWSYPVNDLRSWLGSTMRRERTEGGIPGPAWRGGWRAVTTVRDPLPTASMWIDPAVRRVRSTFHRRTARP